MDAVLFHPETSQRRALILALGTTARDELSPDEREPLVEQTARPVPQRPRQRHPRGGRVDPAAMEAAGEAQGPGCRVDEAQGPGRPALVRQQPGTDLRRDRGAGRVPHGLAGDGAETECIPENETPRRVVIPRRFAIAAKEVTVEQYQRFVKTNAELGSPRAS